MRGFLIRFGGEVRAAIIINRRYWLETVATWIGFILVFAALFFGIRVIVAGVGLSGWGQEAAIRYAVWMLCLNAVVGLPQWVQEEAMTGVLEQRFLIPKGGISSLIMYHIGGLLIWLWGTVLVFFVLIFVAQTPVHLDVGIVPVVLLILIGIEGVGFLLAGLALLFKRIGAVAQLLQMALLGLALLPADRLSDVWQMVVPMLPLANGLPLLNDLLLNRTDFPAMLNRPDFWILLGSSAGYLAVGLAGLRWMTHKAQKNGLLGQY